MQQHCTLWLLSFVLYCCKIVTEIYCVLTPARLHTSEFFFSFYFPPLHPALPPKELHSFLSHLLCCLKAKNRESGGNWSCKNPDKLQIFVGKEAIKHIHKKTPKTVARVVPGPGHWHTPAISCQFLLVLGKGLTLTEHALMLLFTSFVYHLFICATINLFVS